MLFGAIAIDKSKFHSPKNSICTEQWYLTRPLLVKMVLNTLLITKTMKSLIDYI